MNVLHYKSVFVQSNYWQSAFVGKFFLLWVLVDGNRTKVSFFENSAWTMTKALCLIPMAGYACYSFLWLSYFYHFYDFRKNRKCDSEVYENRIFSDISLSVTIFKSKTLFTWSEGPRSSGVGFFWFVSPRAWKQKKPTPLDRGPPLHVNRP